MLLSHTVDTSARVARTRSRTEKIGHLASCLQQIPHAELATGSAYLAGYLPQGRIGIGPSILRRSLPETAATAPELSLSQVDQTFEQVTRTSGSGATARRLHLLVALLARATRSEQEFLVRLLMGELRQGSLEGLMAEAIGKGRGGPDRCGALRMDAGRRPERCGHGGTDLGHSRTRPFQT